MDIPDNIEEFGIDFDFFKLIRMNIDRKINL